MGSIKSWTLIVFGLVLSGCVFDPAPLHRLNAQFDENSRNLEQDARHLTQLAGTTVQLYYDLQIASARRHVREEFRGAYIGPTPTEPQGSIESGKLSDVFRRENADLPVNYVLEAGYFANSFENANAFTLDGGSKVDFIELHSKVLTGEVGVLSGEPLRRYSDTCRRYYAFLDRYKPAQTYVKKKAAFEDAWARLQAVLDEELANNREFLQGYRRVAQMKDPLTEILNSLRLSNEDRDAITNVIKEITDSGVVSVLNNKLEE
jgi:hypothetical protein